MAPATSTISPAARSAQPAPSDQPGTSAQPDTSAQPGASARPDGSEDHPAGTSPSAEERRVGRTAAKASGAKASGAKASGVKRPPFERTLEVVPWHDAEVERTGHDPRGDYVERFWLPILGPSTTWLVRRFARGLIEHPGGIRVDLAETGLALGLGDNLVKSAAIQRSLVRACQFGLAARVSEHRLALRTRFPAVSVRRIEHLPDSLQLAHDRWFDASRTPNAVANAFLAADALARAGEPLGVVERQLVAWNIPPDIARDAALEAFDR